MSRDSDETGTLIEFLYLEQEIRTYLELFISEYQQLPLHDGNQLVPSLSLPFSPGKK